MSGGNLLGEGEGTSALSWACGKATKPGLQSCQIVAPRFSKAPVET